MYKHHNPTIAQPYLDELLEKLGSNWDDYTWGNNLCASIGCEYGHNKIIIVLIKKIYKDIFFIIFGFLILSMSNFGSLADGYNLISFRDLYAPIFRPAIKAAPKAVKPQVNKVANKAPNTGSIPLKKVIIDSIIIHKLICFEIPQD